MFYKKKSSRFTIKLFLTLYQLGIALTIILFMFQKLLKAKKRKIILIIHYIVNN
jgi:hypothetical protein